VNNNTQNQQGYQYSWTWGDNTSSTQMNPPNHTYSGSGTYTITLYVTSGGCVDTAQQVITLNGSGVTAQFSNTTVCLNNATQFTDQTTGNPATWSWNFGDPNSGPNNTSTQQNPSHTFTASGTYTVTLVAAPTNQSCGDTVTLVVTVNPLPSPAFAATSVCVGSPTQFTDQSTIQTGSITAWAWNFGDPNSGPNNLSTQQNPSHTFTAAGTYTVTLTTTSSNGCLNSTTMVVTVYPLPVAAFTAPAVCTGSPMPFTDQSTGATQWSWDFGDNTTGSTQNPSHSYANAGNYTVTLVVTGQGGCTASAQVQVTVNPGPASAFVATTVCVGNPTIFTDQSSIQSGNITAWSWNFGDNTTSAQQSPSHTYVNAGTYQVSLTTTSNNGCTNTVTIQVVVNPLPQAAFTNTSVCVGSPTNFTDQSTISTGNINSWAWNFGDNSTASTQNPSHTYAAAGTYTVTLVVNSASSCQDSVQQVINVYALPVVQFTADDTDGCVTHCVNFTDQSTVTGGNITGWLWDFGDGGQSASQNPNHCYTTPGTYDVTLTVTSSNGCTSTYTNFAYIVVYPLPTAEFSASPNPTTVIDPTIHFTDLSLGNPVTWTWTFGDMGTDSVQNPTHVYPNDNTGVHTYTVTLYITDVHGCTSQVSHDVEVDPEFTFYVPNCFTPNNDGVNELFFTYGIGVKTFKMWIFDRWGNKIWWSDDMNKGWDGKVIDGPSGDIVQEDVYVWKVQLTDVFDKKHSYVGHVSVIK
jgi:gliding motility-associated-like protein